MRKEEIRVQEAKALAEAKAKEDAARQKAELE